MIPGITYIPQVPNTAISLTINTVPRSGDIINKLVSRQKEDIFAALSIHKIIITPYSYIKVPKSEVGLQNSNNAMSKLLKRHI